MTTPSHHAAADAADLTASAARMKNSAVAVLSSLTRIATLEARLAGLSLSVMLAMALAMGLLACAAWVLLNLAFAFWLTELGLHVSLALFAAAALNVIATLLLWHGVKGQSRGLQFTATRKALGLTPAVDNTVDKSVDNTIAGDNAAGKTAHAADA